MTRSTGGVSAVTAPAPAAPRPAGGAGCWVCAAGGVAGGVALVCVAGGVVLDCVAGGVVLDCVGGVAWADAPATPATIRAATARSFFIGPAPERWFSRRT